MIPTCINASSTIQTTSKPFRQPTTTFIFDKIQRDFNALTRRVTAYHILLPNTATPTKVVIDSSGVESSSLQLYDIALTLKQKIRNKASDQMYIVDAFNEAARRYSIDKETAVRGGLLGTLVPQGYCRAPELDQACFEVPLGEVSGPIVSEYGYHLLLVEERTNCPKLDGKYTRISRGSSNENGMESTDVVMSGSQEEDGNRVGAVVVQQIVFWTFASFAGGIVAEIAARVSQ